MGKRMKRNKARQIAPVSSVWKNFALDSAEGCYIAHGEGWWILESSPFEEEEWGAPEEVPDLSLDPESNLLTAINTSMKYKSFFISFPYRAMGNRDQILRMGKYSDEEGVVKEVTTLVVVLMPSQVMDLCILDIPDDIQDVQLFSDIKELPEEWSFDCVDNGLIPPIGPYLFPLGGKDKIFCSQGTNGGFTHFYPETRFAVDLECAIGTSVLAVGDGVVLEINQCNTVSGIHVDNLFKWNSIMIQLDDGNFVEYVHIQTNSALVEKGDRVLEGQVICKTGNIGFCPSPHLHIQFHTSKEPNAKTVPFTFKHTSNPTKPFCPLAGKLYDCNPINDN